MPSDVFRPRLPLDPFAALDHPPPWRITSSDPPEPLLAHTVLILGTPSHTDLIPLATSSHLVHSLLLIATHTPPPVPVPSPHTAGPAIIILHLPAPLDIHDSGAVRLVGVLDRAQRVAHAWRTATLPQRRIQQFAELYPGGEFSISEDPELAAIISNTAAPGVLHRNGKTSSSSPLASDTDDTVSLSSTSSVFSSTSSSFRRKSKNGTNPKQTHTTQPQFSALINFLPLGVPDKSLLKHAILVTTLATPFLAPPQPLTSTFSPYQQKSQSKRQSIFSSLSLSSLGSSQKNQSQHRSRSRTRLPSLFTSAPPPSSSFTSSFPPSVFAASTETLALVKHQHSLPHLVHVLPYSASYPHPHPHPHRSTTAPSPSTYLSPNNNVHATKRSSGAGIGIGKGKAPIHAYGKWNVKSKLVQSIEQFLLSFAYPPSGAGSGSASASSPALSTSSSSSLSGSISVSSSGLAPPLPPPPPAKSPLRGSPLGRGGVVNGNAGVSIREEKRRSANGYGNGYRNGYHATSHSMSMPVPPLMPLPPPKAAAMMTTKWEQGQQGQAVPYLLPAGVLGARPAASSSPASSLSVSGTRSVSSGSAFLHPNSALNGLGHGTGTGNGDEMCIGELILLGLLDGVASGDNGAQGGAGEEGWPRAWIGAGGQVEVVEVGESKVLSSSAGVGVVQPKRAVTREDEKEERHARVQNRTKSRDKSGSAPVGAGAGAGAGMGGIGASVTPNMPYTDTTTTTTGNAKGKGRSPPHTPTHGQGSVPISVRRNEAGLPTPPESSSSLEGESDEDPDQDPDRQGEDADEEDEGEGDGSSLGFHSQRHVYATPTPPEVYEPDQEREESEKEMERLAGAGKTRPGKTGEGKTETKRKLLRTRVSRFFGRRGEGEGVVGVVTLEYEEVGVKRGTGAMGRLKRVWAA